MTRCYQINLQTGWGGGEVYTAFLTRSLLRLGVPTTLFVHSGNPHWTGSLPAECTIIPVEGMGDIAGKLAGAANWLLFHTPAGGTEAASLRRAGHFLSAIVHMPLYGRDPTSLHAYDLVYAVSSHVIDSLHAAGIHQVHGEPLWGVADLAGRDGAADTPIFAASPYDWDLRKGRDRLLSLVYPPYAALRPKHRFTRAPGVTLGVVSRLTPIKQFPMLFRKIVPVLTRHPEFRLEIFGAGGYASVRDMRRALEPVRERVRYWGQQRDVGAVYRKLDYLLSGLPEKEALGLNILEAQACGTPVLAVKARPFTEIVADGVTGLFYEDPRTDAGASFEGLLQQLAAKPFLVSSELAARHLEQFSEAAFTQRVSRLIEATARMMSGQVRQSANVNSAAEE
jgi:glycosyltransferase involved in cell wall biosynthesis